MAVRFKISKGRKKTSMKLPLTFLEHFLPKVNGDYLRIYLYGLKACLENKSLSDADIADIFGILPSDVVNAWSFWEKEGAVLLNEDGTVEFINPEELEFSKEEAKPKKDDNFDKIFSQAKKDKKFMQAVTAIESVYPELLTQNDVVKLYDIVITQGISAELFLITAAHCFKMKKNRFSYIAKVLTETHKKGYTTPETMELYYQSITENMQIYGRIKKLLKISTRDLIDREKEYIDKWLSMGKSDDEIKEAFEKTVMNTGKLSFPYMDKILSGGSGNNRHSASSVKPGPLNNFKQEMPDFKAVEDLLWEQQKNL